MQLVFDKTRVTSWRQKIYVLLKRCFLGIQPLDSAGRGIVAASRMANLPNKRHGGERIESFGS